MQRNRQNRITKYERYLLIFTLVDILFAPYVFFLATTYSQLFVFVWFIFKDKSFFNRKELRFYYAISWLMLLSVFASLLFIPKGDLTYYFIDNFKRGLNIALGISYYFFFYYTFKIQKIRIDRWLIAFVLIVTLWGAIYFFNINSFISLKLIFNPRDATIGYFFNKTIPILRFNYIYTDPNNIGYTLVGVVAFLIMNRKVTNKQLIVVILSLLFNLLIIMSTGAIVAAAISIPASYLIRLRHSRKLIDYVVLTTSFIVILFIGQRFYTDFSTNEVIEYSISRQEVKTETGDSRPRIWEKLIKSKSVYIYYLVLGEGSVIFVDGKPYKPHSGHLDLIFGYGLICYFLYMFIVFRKSRKQKWIDYLYIFPFFLCFTLNVGIGELKFAAIMYMMVAASRILNRKYLILNQL